MENLRARQLLRDGCRHGWNGIPVDRGGTRCREESAYGKQALMRFGDGNHDVTADVDQMWVVHVVSHVVTSCVQVIDRNEVQVSVWVVVHVVEYDINLEAKSILCVQNSGANLGNETRTRNAVDLHGVTMAQINEVLSVGKKRPDAP